MGLVLGWESSPKCSIDGAVGLAFHLMNSMAVKPYLACAIGVHEQCRAVPLVFFATNLRREERGKRKGCVRDVWRHIETLERR